MAPKAKKGITEAQADDSSFKDTARDWARRWEKEISAAKKEPRFDEFRRRGIEIDKAYRDERDSKNRYLKRLTLFSTNVNTQIAITYGKVPSVDVDRKYADAKDDVARVGGELLDRVLNCDIQRDSDTFRDAMGYALQDKRLTGLGCAKVRYDFEEAVIPGKPAMVSPEGIELAPAVEESTQIVRQEAEVDWIAWDRVLWGEARVWHELRWLAFETSPSRAEMIRKFGEDIAKAIPYEGTKKEDGQKETTPWDRARLWEIWDRDTRSVFFFVQGYSEVLTPKDLAADAVNPNGSVKDPLQLEGFWPCARFMLSNATTSSLVPVADYYLAQDLYREVDSLTTRIDLLIDAVKVRGAYDAGSSELAKILDGPSNKMVPVTNWKMFAEKGGIQGVIDWMPLDQIVSALAVLKEQRRETMDLLFQVTGMSDLMRGQATQAGATATEQRAKMQFGSVRIQAEQDDFARFCSETQRIRAQIICRHFTPETILERSNMKFSPEEQGLVMQALEFLKSGLTGYRIEVKAENVSLTDFAAQKQESMEVLAGISSFFQGMTPVAQAMPGSTPMLWEMLGEGVSRIRGAKSFEGIFDRMVQAAEQAQQAQAGQPPPPSPEEIKLETVKAKGQMDLEKEKMKQQGDLVRINAEVQADAQREETQAQWNVIEASRKAQISHATKALNPGPVVPRRIRP